MITTILCSLGVYCLLQPAWTWLEALELGVANTTIVDSAICYVISLIIAFIVVDLDI